MSGSAVTSKRLLGSLLAALSARKHSEVAILAAHAHKQCLWKRSTPVNYPARQPRRVAGPLSKERTCACQAFGTALAECSFLSLSDQREAKSRIGASPNGTGGSLRLSAIAGLIAGIPLRHAAGH